MPKSFTSRPRIDDATHARRSRTRWLSYELEALLLHLHAGTSVRVIALRLGRTEIAVRRMAARLVGTVAMQDVPFAERGDASFGHA